MAFVAAILVRTLVLVHSWSRWVWLVVGTGGLLAVARTRRSVFVGHALRCQALAPELVAVCCGELGRDLIQSAVTESGREPAGVSQSGRTSVGAGLG